MSRLTRNQEKFWGKGNYKGEKYIIGSNGVTSKQMCLDKLGELEDLEEQIGCPLEVVFKALQNGVYYEDVANRMTHIGVGLDTANYECEYLLREYDNVIRFLPRNYKRTWWLRKDKSE